MNLEKRKLILENAIDDCKRLETITTHDIITLFLNFYQKSKLLENPDEVVFDWQGDLEIFGYDEITLNLYHHGEDLILFMERRTRPYLGNDEEQLKLFLRYKNQLLSEDLKKFLQEELRKVTESNQNIKEFLCRIENDEAYSELKNKVPEIITIRTHYDA